MVRGHGHGQAGTIARLAFCAALLADRSRRPLQRLAEQHEERLAIEAAEVGTVGVHDLA